MAGEPDRAHARAHRRTHRPAGPAAGRRTRSSTSPAPTARARRRAWSSRCCGRSACAPACSRPRTSSDARERICFDGEPISAERLLATWEEIEPYVAVVDANSAADGGVPLSYFEVMTALAFAAFADAPVDVAIVEVGLGGGWDSTNVADGVVAVIAPVGLDHSDYLGDSIAGIAREKAGIIKPGCDRGRRGAGAGRGRGHPRARCRGGRRRGARGPGVRRSSAAGWRSGARCSTSRA